MWFSLLKWGDYPSLSHWACWNLMGPYKGNAGGQELWLGKGGKCQLLACKWEGGRLWRLVRTKRVLFFSWGWLSGKESACQCRSHRRYGFDLWVGKIPWKRKWHPLQYSCLRNTMERGAIGSRVGYDWLTKHAPRRNAALTTLCRLLICNTLNNASVLF